MITFEISEKDIFRNNEIMKLSLLISGDNFLFAIKSMADDKIKSIREFSFSGKYGEEILSELGEIITRFGYNSEMFYKKNIGVVTKDFSIVPNALKAGLSINQIMDPVSIDHYSDDHSVIKSTIEKIDSSIFFTLPNTQLSIFSNKPEHSSTVHCIEYLTLYLPEFIDDSDFVYCNFSGGSIQLISYRDRKLINSQVFFEKTADGMLYDIVSAFYRNGLPVNTIPIYLSGRIEEGSKIYNILCDHIKNVRFISLDSSSCFSEQFSNIPSHRFFDIYSLSRCV